MQIPGNPAIENGSVSVPLSTLSFTAISRIDGGVDGDLHGRGFARIQIYAAFLCRRVGSGEAGSAGAKRHADGAHRVLDRRPAGAVCFAMARGKDGEDAKGAAPRRDAESVWVMAQGICGGREEGTSTELTTEWKRRTGTWRGGPPTPAPRAFCRPQKKHKRDIEQAPAGFKTQSEHTHR